MKKEEYPCILIEHIDIFVTMFQGIAQAYIVSPSETMVLPRRYYLDLRKIL